MATDEVKSTVRTVITDTVERCSETTHSYAAARRKTNKRGSAEPGDVCRCQNKK